MPIGLAPKWISWMYVDFSTFSYSVKPFICWPHPTFSQPQNSLKSSHRRSPTIKTENILIQVSLQMLLTYAVMSAY